MDILIFNPILCCHISLPQYIIGFDINPRTALATLNMIIFSVTYYLELHNAIKNLKFLTNKGQIIDCLGITW